MKRYLLSLMLAAACALLLAATADAYTGAVSPGGEIAMASSGKLTFRMGEIVIECNWTMSGAFNSSIANLETAAEQEVASVRSVSWRECSGGELASVLGTPWSFQYTGETGSMPNEVTSMQMTLHGFTWLLKTFGGFVSCLYAGDLPFVMAMLRTRTAGIYTTGALRVTEGAFSKVSGSLCPERGTATATFSMNPTQRITIS